MILAKKTELAELQRIEPQYFDEMVKIVIDSKRRLIATNMEMHSDLALELYDDGSDETDLYGANIYFDDGSIEWSSTINIKQNRRIQNGTFGRIITDEETISMLTDIINEWIYR